MIIYLKIFALTKVRNTIYNPFFTVFVCCRQYVFISNWKVVLKKIHHNFLRIVILVVIALFYHSYKTAAQNFVYKYQLLICFPILPSRSQINLKQKRIHNIIISIITTESSFHYHIHFPSKELT